MQIDIEKLKSDWVRATGHDEAQKDVVFEVMLAQLSLLQKLVEKGNKTKVISTEVPMTAKEQELLDSIEA